MTDWDEIVGYIDAAMQAVGEAHAASATLQQDTNHESFQAFRKRMEELEERLQQLMTVLNNEEAFAMDELMDALSKVYSERAADYRKTPRMTP